MERYDYRGSVHVHSTYSDGKGDVEEVMADANEAGLDFVILTDHNTLQAAADGHEKWHGSSLLIVGTEISPPDNHLVAFGTGKLPDVETLREKSPQEFIDAVNKAGWLGFMAHPDYIGTKKLGEGTFRWTDWSVKNFTGLSIWNLLDDWKRQVSRDGIAATQMYDEFPAHLQGPQSGILEKWDELLKDGRVVAIGETDNHKMTRKYEEREFVIFPYEMAFRTITNHLLLTEPLSKDAAEAKKQVVDGFRRGASYISIDWADDPTEFSFYIEHDMGQAYPGDEFTVTDEDEIWVSLPTEAEIRVIRNGELVKATHHFELVERLPGPGTYRVEVHKDNRPWIFSNPVYAKR